MIVFSSKKAQTHFEIAIIVIILLIAAFSYVTISMVQKNISSEMLASGELGVEATASLTQFDADFTTSLDNTFLLVFVLLWVSVIVTILFVDANPVFLIVSLILVVIVLSVVGVMSNTYEEFIIDEDIYTFSAGFPKTNYVMEHLVMFTVFIAISSMLAIYGKNQFGGGY